MNGPVILAVDEDPDALRDIDQELNDRYARHYRVRTMPSALEAREWLEELSAAGDEVALILAGQSLSGMTGSELLNEATTFIPMPSARSWSRGVTWAIGPRAKRSSTR